MIKKTDNVCACAPLLKVRLGLLASQVVKSESNHKYSKLHADENPPISSCWQLPLKEASEEVPE